MAGRCICGIRMVDMPKAHSCPKEFVARVMRDGVRLCLDCMGAGGSVSRDGGERCDGCGGDGWVKVTA
jgi:hypothetical protein